MKINGEILIKMGLVLVFIVGFYYLNNHVFKSGVWRYKITVVVETPEGDKTGSSVQEISVHSGLALTPGASAEMFFKGEPVVVDLGARGVLFALINFKKNLPFYMFPSGRGYTTIEGINYYEDLKTKPEKLDAYFYPEFVRFRDPKNPKTAENLIETSCCKFGYAWDSYIMPNTHSNTNDMRKNFYIKQSYFEAAFGVGVQLKSVMIEMTDEPPTIGGIEKAVALLSDRRMQTCFFGDHSQPPFSDYRTQVCYLGDHSQPPLYKATWTHRTLAEFLRFEGGNE